jgi:hypothetical protein
VVCCAARPYAQSNKRCQGAGKKEAPKEASEPPKHIQSLVLRYLDPISEDHWKSLYLKKRQLISKDEFGIEDETGQNRWNQEILRYIEKLIVTKSVLSDKILCYDHVQTLVLRRFLWVTEGSVQKAI